MDARLESGSRRARLASRRPLNIPPNPPERSLNDARILALRQE